MRNVRKRGICVTLKTRERERERREGGRERERQRARPKTLKPFYDAKLRYLTL